MLQRPDLAYELTAEGIYDKPLQAFIDAQKKPGEHNPPDPSTGLEDHSGSSDDEGSTDGSDDVEWKDNPKISGEEKRVARKENKKKVKEEKREARKSKIPKAEKKRRRKIAKAKCSR